YFDYRNIKNTHRDGFCVCVCNHTSVNQILFVWHISAARHFKPIQVIGSDRPSRVFRIRVGSRKSDQSMCYLYLSVLSLFLMGPGCKPCLQDWIIFKKKCYLFYDEPAPWKTWEQSRRFCQDRRADLVVIDDLEEQEFVNKHINHDKHNGYWMGLQHLNSKWTWVDGRNKKQRLNTQVCRAKVFHICSIRGG
uniref:C-type lectin domain-containing protein n=1 Tax=Poecilia latipinna TaxID=48699 RepID=A0A3B3VCG2_9TELE